ncbi:MAG: hypothetical protein DRN88_00455 [Candidatus Hydrothermarchaeota archaeon]|nr:MAG: hypothetical protein DRN88_00455 [Candidatus Hydrothermarchaeota archaeon]
MIEMIETDYKKIACVGFVFLLVAGVATAQPFAKFEKFKPRHPHIKPIIVGDGFAITGDEYHVVFVSVVKKKNILPGWAKKYLEENNLQGLLEELENASLDYRGRLVFAGKKYMLRNIEANETYLDAEIFGKPQENATSSEAVGHITIDVEKYESARVGVGTLTINEESYKLLLTMKKPHKMGKKIQRHKEKRPKQRMLENAS